MIDNSMKEYKQMILRIIRYTSILIVIFLAGIITPYSSVFLGLALGTSVGLFNFLITVWKVNQIGEIAANTGKSNKGKPVFSGMATRFSLAILAVMLVYKFPHYVNLISTIIGLFITQIIIVVDNLKHN